MRERRLVHAITLGELYRDDLDLDPLIAAIQTQGHLLPILVTDSGQLLSGQRRLAAASSLGYTHIACTVVTDFDEALRALHNELEYTEARTPLRPSELARHIAALQERMTGILPPRTAKHGTGRTLSIKERLGEAVGLNPRAAAAASRAHTLTHDPDSTPAERGTGRETLRLMDQTGKIRAPAEWMYDQLRILKASTGDEPPEPPEQPEIVVAARRQHARSVGRGELRRARDRQLVLDRFTEGIGNQEEFVEHIIERTPDLNEFTKDEITEWLDRLRRGRAGVNRLIKYLEGPSWRRP